MRITQHVSKAAIVAPFRYSAYADAELVQKVRNFLDVCRMFRGLDEG